MSPANKPHRGRVIAVLMILALVVAACGGNSSPEGDKSTTAPGKDGSPTTTKGGGETPAPGNGFNEAQFEGEPAMGGSITFGVESEIATLDPAGALAQPADVNTALAIYDPLIGFNDKGEKAPNLATKWESSKDLKTWTITLRSDVKFTDGTPFNADAVVTNYKRFKDPATNCICAPVVAAITNIEATDPTTVVFTLADPNAFFPSVLASITTGGMASPAALAKEGKDYGRNPVGTGPFILQSFDSLILKKNPNYWKKDDKGRQLPYLDSIKVQPITDAQVRLQSLKSGDIDALQTADTATVADAVEDGSFKIQKVTGSSSTITLFNLRKPPFDEPRLRMAVALGFDRDELNNVLYRGARQPAYSAFAADSPFFTPAAPKRDVAKAKALVDELKKEGKPVKFTATCIATPEGRDGLNLARNNAVKLGLDQTNEFLDQGAYVNKVLGAGHDFLTGCFRSPQIADADGLYNALHTGGSANPMGYSNADVDKWLEAVRNTTDQAEHVKLLKQVQEQVAKDVPTFPLLYDLFANIYNPDISGFPIPQANSLGAINFATLYRKK